MSNGSDGAAALEARVKELEQVVAVMVLNNNLGKGGYNNHDGFCQCKKCCWHRRYMHSPQTYAANIVNRYE
jgi:hypothetical protein